MTKLPTRFDKNVRITDEAHKKLEAYIIANPIVKIGRLASHLIIKGVKELETEEKR